MFAQHACDPGDVIAAIETDKNFLVVALQGVGVAVYAINPKAVARYRERHRQAGGKSDSQGALMLGEHPAHRSPRPPSSARYQRVRLGRPRPCPAAPRGSLGSATHGESPSIIAALVLSCSASGFPQSHSQSGAHHTQGVSRPRPGCRADATSDCGASWPKWPGDQTGVGREDPDCSSRSFKLHQRPSAEAALGCALVGFVEVIFAVLDLPRSHGQHC